MDSSTLPYEAAVKPSPRLASSSTFVHVYFPSPAAPSGLQTDSNLLILLHGLGDTHSSFAKLGTSLQRTLPQTAVLSLQGGRRVPYIEEEGYTWWETWDQLGELLPSPDPRDFLKRFTALLDHLTLPEAKGGCGWPSTAIHVLGFGQGATAALEGVVAWVRQGRTSAPASSSGGASSTPKIQEITDEEKGKREERRLGSVVTICAGLLSHPTFSPPLSMPVFLYHRAPAPRPSRHISALRKAFRTLVEHRSSSSSKTSEAGVEEESMPRPNEWEPILRFWAQRAAWRNRLSWEVKAADGAGKPRAAGEEEDGFLVLGGGEAAGRVREEILRKKEEDGTEKEKKEEAKEDDKTGSELPDKEDTGWTPTREELSQR